MSINNFIPTVWSETLLTELEKQFVAVAHCNRDFEGEIKGKGSTVNICGVGDITIKDYTKDIDMGYPETLTETMTSLVIISRSTTSTRLKARQSLWRLL